MRDLLLAVVLAAFYGWTAAYLIRVYLRRFEAGALPLAVVLVVFAVEQLHHAVLYALDWGTGYVPEYASYLRFADFLLQTLAAVGVIIVYLKEDENALRDVLRRLAEPEDHIRPLLEFSGVGIALLTPQGQFVEANSALERLLGYSAGELRRRKLIELAHPADLPNWEGKTEKNWMNPAALYQRERRFRRKEGGTVWARVVRMPLRDADGAVRYIVAVLLDVTERRCAEEALVASEARYRLHFEGASDGIYLCTEAGTFVDVNPTFCRMIGYSDKETRSLTVADLAEDLPGLRRHFAAVLGRGEDRLETRLRHKDGRRVDVEVSSAIITLQGQRLVHGISRDIGERKRADEALKRAEEVLREERDFSNQILEAADTLILVLDPQGRIVRFNCKCVEVTGYREEEVRGRVFWEFLPPERLRDGIREDFARLLSEKAPSAIETPWRTRPGPERWIAWRDTTVRDAQGGVRYVIGAGLDITDQRRLEEQLRQSQKMETVGTLVGGIAHDFNNQLTVIMGNLRLLLLEAEPGANGHRFLVDAERAARRCGDMTAGLLAFSRRHVGRLQFVQLNQVVAEAVRLLQRVLPASIAIDVKEDRDLWVVRADNTQLHQVLMNLAVNSRDAMPQGGTLTFTSANRLLSEEDAVRNVDARPGKFVVLSVRDSGTGMTPEVQARMFEPFYTTKPAGQGTGLGLAMVFGIVKAHHGWIVVDSVPGEGSTFSVYLPAADVADYSIVEEVEPTVRGGNECILVVEDEEMLRNLAQGALERWGYRVLTAANGDEALAAYQKYAAEVDLVLLDLTMPRLSGLQVHESLRRINPDVRIVFTSGRANQGDIDHLLEAGARGFLPKPYMPEELVQKVRQALDSTTASEASPGDPDSPAEVESPVTAW
jgi:PAS domain S-box-containing protein